MTAVKVEVMSGYDVIDGEMAFGVLEPKRHGDGSLV